MTEIDASALFPVEFAAPNAEDVAMPLETVTAVFLGTFICGFSGCGTWNNDAVKTELLPGIQSTGHF